MGTSTAKAKKLLGCALLMVAMCLAGTSGAQPAAGDWSAPALAYAITPDGGAPPPDLD
jgi:hypothetical protein